MLLARKTLSRLKSGTDSFQVFISGPPQVVEHLFSHPRHFKLFLMSLETLPITVKTFMDKLLRIFKFKLKRVFLESVPMRFIIGTLFVLLAEAVLELTQTKRTAKTYLKIV